MKHPLKNIAEGLSSIAEKLDPKMSPLAKRIFNYVDNLEEYIEEDNMAKIVQNVKIRCGFTKEVRTKISTAQKRAWTPERRALHSQRMRDYWNGQEEITLIFTGRNSGSWLVKGWDEIEAQSGIKRTKIKHYLKPKTHNEKHLQFIDKYGDIITISRAK